MRNTAKREFDSRNQETVCWAEMVELMPALNAFARSLCRNADRADDLVQETLVRAIANLDKFAPGTYLKSWLFTIMRNAFLNGIKISSRERLDSDLDLLLLPSIASQEWSLRSRDVANAIDSLPGTQREALIAVCMLGVSYEEAAEIFDCGIGALKTRVNRARTNLITALGEKNTDEAANVR